MILASFDLECTGLDLNGDRIVEVGLALYSTGRERVLECTSFLVNSDGIPITDEIKEITGISQDMADKFGYEQKDAIEASNEYFMQADAVIGHNILWYDLPMIRNTAKRIGAQLHLPNVSIDTMTDIPGVKGEQLITMCAKAKDPKTGRDVGFSYTKHSALDDAKAVVRLISWHDINQIVSRACSPTFVVLSHQDRGDAANKSARKAGFRWSGQYKCWWQAVKECDFEGLREKISKTAVPFQISITKDIPLESLRD